MKQLKWLPHFFEKNIFAKSMVRSLIMMLFVYSIAFNLTGMFHHGTPNYAAFVFCMFAYTLSQSDETFTTAVLYAIIGVILTFIL
jgi:hypothetical protein